MEYTESELSAETARWLDDRRRPGNWIAIAPDDEIPSDIPGWNRTILHMFQIAISPEIERRLAAGALGQDFELYSAQLIQPPDGSQLIRLNGEVRGLPLIRLTRSVERGDPILMTDLKGLVSFDLDEEELDCGHFTMFWHGSGWVTSFDFRSGRAKASQMIASAMQFFAAAQFSASQSHPGPSIDNLFSACELLSKAHLMLHHSNAAKSKKHGAVSSALNAWGKLGNIDAGFVKIFNRMSNLRSAARYEAAQLELPTAADFEIVQRELSLLERAVAHRTKERATADLGGNARPDSVLTN